jgi:hypothetical protein
MQPLPTAAEEILGKVRHDNRFSAILAHDRILSAHESVLDLGRIDLPSSIESLPNKLQLRDISPAPGLTVVPHLDDDGALRKVR